MSPDEADKLSAALNKFAKEFNVQVNPKIVAAVGLVTTSVAIYAPRGFAIYRRKLAEKAERVKKLKEAEGKIEVSVDGVKMEHGTEEAV